MSQLETYSIKQLKSMRTSKGQLFQSVESTWDYALPQSWLDIVSKYAKSIKSEVNYQLILSSTVWSYPSSQPMTACKEVAELIKQYNALPDAEYNALFNM